MTKLINFRVHYRISDTNMRLTMDVNAASADQARAYVVKIHVNGNSRVFVDKVKVLRS